MLPIISFVLIDNGREKFGIDLSMKSVFGENLCESDFIDRVLIDTPVHLKCLCVVSFQSPDVHPSVDRLVVLIRSVNVVGRRRVHVDESLCNTLRLLLHKSNNLSTDCSSPHRCTSIELTNCAFEAQHPHPTNIGRRGESVVTENN